MKNFVMIIVAVAFVATILILSGMIGTLSALAQLLLATFIVLAFTSALIILPHWKSPKGR
jgi:hypothetical protein